MWFRSDSGTALRWSLLRRTAPGVGCMKRSKENLRFAGFAAGSKEDSLELVCLGIPCTLFPGESEAARYVFEERHLQDWFSDSDTRVDRFDVRLLLDSLRQFDVESDSEGEEKASPSGVGGLSGEQAALEAEVESERYRDLHAAHAAQLRSTTMPGPSHNGASRLSHRKCRSSPLEVELSPSKFTDRHAELHCSCRS